MGYKALYREFRPLRFEDLVGQDHISQILKNQIINDRIGHAYLFSGIRGTGKTTTAKIFARAINCLNPIDGEPCNECEICKGILNESLSDVTEIDAASNNGVDNIREIREEVMYLPTKAKYRVYIIDEVHMLSTGAFNALLKTLEEPPKHVKFILATTEPNKLPATILSRCQRFDFKRISNSDVVKRLQEILDAIDKKADVNALKMIAEVSEGAMRDAISILDRCVSDSDNITVDYVAELIGMPNGIEVLEIVDGIVDRDAKKVVSLTDELLNKGKNVNVLLSEMIKHLQNILVYNTIKEISVYSEEENAKIQNISNKVSNEKIINMIVSLSEILNIIRWSSNQNIIVKSQLIKLCLETTNDGFEDLKRRIESLENGNVKITKKKTDKVDNKIEKVEEQPVKQVEEQFTDQEEQVLNEMESNVSQFKIEFDEKEWKDILQSLKEDGKVKLYTNLLNASANMISNNIIGIYFKIEFAKKLVDTRENILILREYIKKQIGRDCEIKCFYEVKETKNKISGIEDTAKQFNIPIDIVDE